MWRIAPMALGLLFLWAAAGMAAEVDVANCRSGSVTVLHAEKALTIVSIDIKGVGFSQNSDKVFDKTPSHCVGVVRITPDGRAGHGYCKHVDADGDVALIKWNALPPSGGDWSIVGGTGKWVGAKGGGDWRSTTRTKPVAPGTLQTCNHVTGTYTLAK